jgi:hypothetical protein
MHAQLVSRLLREKNSWKLVTSPEVAAKAIPQPAPVLATSGSRELMTMVNSE